jgi:urate oxidase
MATSVELDDPGYGQARVRSAKVELKEHSYGKSGVRLVKVERLGARHRLKDINVNIQLFGDFEAAYWEGDNRLILPTDSMKNTIYAFARLEPMGEIEEFGLRLADHFLLGNSHVSRVRIAITENLWQRIERDGVQHDHAFKLSGPEHRTAIIDHDRVNTIVKAGITGLVILKTAQSAFENFLRDQYTTLKESCERILGTSVTAEWSYRDPKQDFGELWKGVRANLLDTFAAHDSHSVQQTLCTMGEAVLQQFSSIDEIRLSMPNRHCLLVDLSAFEMDNPNEVFVQTDGPSGLIEATLARASGA